MDATCLAATDHLCAIANKWYLVLGAYFLVFFPWAVTSTIDYISGKWRSVKRTRKLARMHIGLSIAPMVYVAVYAEAQRRAGDYKELGAALAALFINLMHLARTIVGNTQLDAFVVWCEGVVECIEALREKVEETGTISSENERREDLNRELMVNDAVVDNELGGTDVTVKLSWSGMWEGIKHRKWQPSSWLTVNEEHAGLCTARWAAAFLCSVGHKLYSRSNGAGKLNQCSNDEITRASQALSSVTWRIHEEGGESEVISVNEVCTATFGSLTGSATYGNDLKEYYYGLIFSSYKFEFDSLCNSYPPSNDPFTSDNRETVAVGLVDSLVLASRLGPRKLASIRRIFDKMRLPDRSREDKALGLFLEQLGLDQSAELRKNLPHIEFPQKMQMVALWDECTNWRVLQATAQSDIRSSLLFENDIAFFIRETSNLTHHELGRRIFEVVPPPECVFNYSRTRYRLYDEYCWADSGYVGIVMETVRTFMATWLRSGSRSPDWKPEIPTDSLEVPLTDYLCTLLKDGSFQIILNIKFWGRFIWDSQRA